VQHHIIGYFPCVNGILIVYLQIVKKSKNLFKNLTLTMHFTIQEDSEDKINFLDIAIY